MSSERARLAILPHDDLLTMPASFARHLRAENKAERTVRTYLEGIARLRGYLIEHGLPLDLASIERGHIEAWLEAMLANGRPSSAANRFRSAQQFFKWAEEEGELDASPMARMRPPRIPDDPPPVLDPDDLRRLLKACSWQSFEDRRDEAIIRVFVGTGARLAEVAALRWDPDHPTANDLDLDQQWIRVVGKGGRARQRLPHHIPGSGRCRRVVSCDLRQ